MHTPLERRYILLQGNYERGERLQAVVPLHPGIFDLPEDTRLDRELAGSSLEAAKEHYGRDATRYCEWLRENMPGSYEYLGLDDYAEWDDSWSFGFEPNSGLLRMSWSPGDEREYQIASVPNVFITNRLSFEGNGKMARPEEAEIVENVACLFKSSIDPDGFLLPKETMLEYENKGVWADAARMTSGWMAEVVANAMCSEHVDNIPQALLLRDWAIEYNNALLRMLETGSHSMQ